MTVSLEFIEIASSHCFEHRKTSGIILCASFIMQVPPFKAVPMKTLPDVDVHRCGGRVHLPRKLQDLVGGRQGLVFLLTVCEPCRHSWALRTTVVLECSCSVPLDVKVVAVNDPFIPLDYLVVCTGDSIAPSQCLKWMETISSCQGSFECMFFASAL